MIAKPVLSGYVLEELLAALVAGSGYSLLTSATQDPDRLVGGSNGLRVHGRGADHQVDVLGELTASTQLTYPLRLFLEAKCRTASSGLRDVRNAVGTIDDVNQFFTPQAAAAWSRPYQQYDYRYALASTSGFSDEAVDYAITHRLSLIDLSSDSAQWLRDAVSRIADELLTLATGQLLETFPVNQMREAMRLALGTWPNTIAHEDDPFDFVVMRASNASRPADGGLASVPLARVCAGARDVLEGHIYFAWTRTPFLLLVLPDDDQGITELPDRSVLSSRLVLVGDDPHSGDLAAEPLDAAPKDLRRRRMRFTVPPQMEPYFFGELHRPTPVGASIFAEGDPRSALAADRSKRTVSVQVRPGKVINLEYAPVELELEPARASGDISQDLGEDWVRLREQVSTRRQGRAVTDAVDEPEEADEVHVAWTREAFTELLRRLRLEGWPHADIIEAAARAGGEITRSDVYTVAGYTDGRTLRGLTRPPARISNDLVDEGILDEQAWWPLWTMYRTGVRASHFGVPPEFSDFVDR